MNTLETILTGFKRKHAEEAAEAIERASARRALMESLRAHEGWAVLMTTLTEASQGVYQKWLRGGVVTPEEQAFARLVQQLTAGPEWIIKEAQEIARSVQGG